MDAVSKENSAKIDFPPDSPHISDSLFSKDQHETVKYLVFYIADEIYAVAARQISEIIQMPNFTPLPPPSAPEWLLGIVNLRGEIISVADLSKLLNGKSFSPSAKTKLVVLRGENSNAALAFTTDKLGEIVSLSNEEIQTGGEKEKRAGKIYLVGSSFYKSKVLKILDAERLIASIKSD